MDTLLDNDQLVQTARMCEQFLQDVNPEMGLQKHRSKVGIDLDDERNFRRKPSGRCVLKLYDRGSFRGKQQDFEKGFNVKKGIRVKSLRAVGPCCWKIYRYKAFRLNG